MTDETREQRADNGGGQPVRQPDGRFAVGNPGGPGRRRGTLDRLADTVAEKVLAALDRRGGDSYIDALADDLYVPLLQAALKSRRRPTRRRRSRPETFF